ncbi:SRPBCC family protein [Verrucomicrobium spinosum]|uniref:SRPBCC family protein n=1 Tax=Verrucomicrobium spinosum TaxID=2736 RepID=UPI0001744BD4|nr:SRPBCC family protein [Verrucomicrobium spinosum]
MFTKIILALVLIVGIFFVAAAFQPKDFSITRATTIEAPSTTVFDQVNDFHKWEAWSPWAKLDPQMKHTFEGPASGTGSSYAWVGNNQVGEGRMTILESRPGELVKIKLEFIKPFAATNTAEFTFKSEGSKTAVDWTMLGEKNLMSKAFGLVMNMDKMIGGDFEKGLADLKRVSEAAAKAPQP